MTRAIALYPTEVKQYTGRLGTYPYTTYGFLPANDPTELAAVSGEPDRVYIPAEGVEVWTDDETGLVMVSVPGEKLPWYDNEVIDNQGHVTDTRLGTTRKRQPDDELVYIAESNWP